jgi:hypothetical protein
MIVTPLPFSPEISLRKSSLPIGSSPAAGCPGNIGVADPLTHNCFHKYITGLINFRVTNTLTNIINKKTAMLIVLMRTAVFVNANKLKKLVIQMKIFLLLYLSFEIHLTGLMLHNRI